MSKEYKPIDRYPDGRVGVTAGKGELSFGFAVTEDDTPFLAISVNHSPKPIGAGDLDATDRLRLLDIKFLNIESVMSLEYILNEIKKHLDGLD
jgi:hypothetical protein